MPLCGSDEIKKKYMHRLNRIEGQLRGIRRMIEEDQDCMSVLKQIAATNGAIRSLGFVLLEEHLQGCVTRAIQQHENDEDMIPQIIELFHKFSK